ncbi:hypothetical protein [Alkaliphilus hydrothermalis]|uniref:Short C-terminal domain-containing protein n=1 Tax=Alkaliphilus hydrothermalis TaxID=1482730 RepID=A0ABS2NRI6_9FIRM|nr:hypothetical protein [Alkaliphilus hydrothermalis]MBM7615189.1 hypothetical protein [Alkaliphilus hydrothermalis]
MEKGSEQIEVELKLLCVKMIDLLNELKEKGITSEDDYKKYVELKQKFLQDNR